jgi:hypothetical protein
VWNLVQENKAAVIGALLRQFDLSYGSDDPIYTPDGEWSYERFERWLVSAGVPAWPRLDSGQLDVEGDEAEEERTFILNALAEKDVAACIAHRLWPCAKSKEFYDIAVQAYGAEAMGEIGRFVGKRLDAIICLPDTADNVVPLNKRVH